jgi:hypothetical protein
MCARPLHFSPSEAMMAQKQTGRIGPSVGLKVLDLSTMRSGQMSDRISGDLGAR